MRIDLVVYAPGSKEAMTVQVKTCLRPKPAGGKGQSTLDWWLRSDSPARLVGLVDLGADAVWLFRHEEFEQKARQTPNLGSGRHLAALTSASLPSPINFRV